MKLDLKKIRLKNFMSIGAKPIELDYIPGLHAVIGKVVGQDTNNGVGKSTLFIDGVIFAIYGTSLRNLNLDQMVNSINQGECEVTLWFTLDRVNYRIERGITPAYLRFINEDEEALQQEYKERGKREVQNEINEKLGISYTTFINKITLNINYSKPLFKLTAAERRQIFEDIMNISVYGKMLEKARKDYNHAKHALKVASAELKSAEELLQNKKQTKDRVEAYRLSFDSNKAAEIKRFEDAIASTERKIEDAKKELTDRDYDDLKTKLGTYKDQCLSKLSSIQSKLDAEKTEISKLEKRIVLIKNNPICPTCNSPTTNEHASKHLEEITEALNNSKQSIITLMEEYGKFSEKLNDAKAKLKKLEETILKNNKVKQQISNLEHSLESYKSQLESAQNKTFDMSNVVTDDDIDQAEKRVLAKRKEHEEIEKQQLFADQLDEILGDKGIKTYIIKRIVPVLNKKINEYLAIFKATYTVAFDHDLNETFKARRRDVFTYNNFSAGEQKRIDLACMFAILDVAKAQNSVDCNLLILDEICDSSMCAEGIGNLMGFLKTDFRKMFPDLCIYVISHKAEIGESNFNTVIKLKKEHNFTKIDEIQECETVLQV